MRQNMSWARVTNTLFVSLYCKLRESKQNENTQIVQARRYEDGDEIVLFLVLSALPKLHETTESEHVCRLLR